MSVSFCGFLKMRLYPVLALMTSAFALAACGGGGGGFGGSVLGVSSGVGNSCPLTNVDTTADADCTDTGPVTPPPVPIVDVDGDGIDDNATNGGNPVDNNGTTGSGAGGNNTDLASGNRTIFMKSFVYDTPTEPGAISALSQLTSDKSATFDGTVAAILHPTNKPKKLKYAIDTKSTSNTNVAVQVEMTEFRPGSRELGWLNLGHHNITTSMTNGYPDLLDANGNRTVVYNATRGSYEYTVTDTVGAVNFSAGQSVNFRDDQFWSQMVAMMDDRANGGAKGNYREYRALSASANRDELMQVWAWDNSYAVQYQNAAGGGEPTQHAWSFGGNAATAMPTGGNATYKGRYVANAKTRNWLQAEGSDINPNALWRVEGQSSFTADFTNGDVEGTLTPETWQSYQGNDGNFTWHTSAADNPSANTLDPVIYYNYSDIYESEVTVAGKITTSGTGTQKNVFSGTATLNEPFSTDDNAAHGGFFGTNGDELTGVFVSDGSALDPLGGSNGVNDNRRGYITITGAFNANCNNPDGVCAP
jgi:C-lobe and N-lobe beta barrels of Tf-binding protein B